MVPCYDDDDNDDNDDGVDLYLRFMTITTEEDGMMTSQTSAMITGGMTDCRLDYQGTRLNNFFFFSDSHNLLTQSQHRYQIVSGV